MLGMRLKIIKRIMLFAALAIAALIAIYGKPHVNASKIEIPAPIVRSPSFSSSDGVLTISMPNATRVNVKKLDRSLPDKSEGNPFLVKVWAATTVNSPPLILAKETSTTPPLPFAYTGKLEESDGRWVVYLVKGDTSFDVHQGETFDTNYRLNAIQAAQLEIEYLPLATKQTLSTVIESQ